MSQDLEHRLAVCSSLLQLELEIRQAQSGQALEFLMVNRTMALLTAAEISFMTIRLGQWRVSRVTGVAEFDLNAPRIRWNEAVVSHLAAQGNAGSITVSIHDLDGDLARDWPDAALPWGLWSPLLGGGDPLETGLWLLGSQPWQPGEIQLIERLSATAAHALQVIEGATPTRKIRWPKKGVGILSGLVLLGVLLNIPVHQTVLAPAVVIPRDPRVITAPMDGIVERITVEPNTTVTVDQPLVLMEQTAAKHARQTALKTLAVAEAQRLKARRLAFSESTAKAELALLEARVEQSQEEVAHAEERLALSVIRSQHAGLAIFEDAAEWMGRPVFVGETIMKIADPLQVQLDIRVPVDEALPFVSGSKVRLFLNTDPLHPVAATLEYAGYEALPAPQGFTAYRVLARFEAPEPPRIGLHGTAQISGDWVSLFHYLFRRPLVTLRRFVGL